MKLISPGSRVKFYTVKLINTKFQITFLSGTVLELTRKNTVKA